jgi:hypothetical protein
VSGATEAFWTSNGFFGDDQLQVYVGPSIELIVTLGPPSDAGFAVDPLAAATQIAEDALARL